MAPRSKRAIDVTKTQTQFKELTAKIDARSKEVTIRPKSVSFKTKKQLTYFQAINENIITLSSGSAGTGKTFVAVYAACASFAAGHCDRIVITKPGVEVGETMGYLPGDMEEKMGPYIRSIDDCLNTIIGREATENLKLANKLQIVPLNYMRGLTFDRTFIICDEAQNCTEMQMKALLTRIGNETKCVINGDLDQRDLEGDSGLAVAIKILENVGSTSHIYFTLDDICRSGIVRDILIEYHNYEHQE